MRLFVAGAAVSALFGGAIAYATTDDGPARRSGPRALVRAANSPGCDAVAQAIQDAAAKEAQPGIEVTDRAARLLSQVKVQGDDTALCASDVDVLTP
jgi:hypothetical protein